MTDVLNRRGAGRATLARQHLLARAPGPVLGTIEHLGGVQAQAAQAPYLGLWSRVREFEPDDLSELLASRVVARLPLMRNTVHLVSARDALSWGPLFRRLHASDYRAHFGDAVGDVDLDALVAHARDLLTQAPRTRSELGRLLAPEWPDVDPAALSYAATSLLAVCQVPPRGLWRRGGPAAWALVEDWLGQEAGRARVDDLVLRYLAAFGPASVADVQTWSGLTRLGEVAERLPLRTFCTEDGERLYDIPGGPRPDPDTPAPPRFLPAYDNVLLSHRDRRRIIPHGRPVPLPPGNGADVGTLLLDGQWQGSWRVRDGMLRVELFRAVSAAERSAVLDEGVRLAALLQPDAPCDIDLTVVSG